MAATFVAATGVAVAAAAVAAAGGRCNRAGWRSFQ